MNVAISPHHLTETCSYIKAVASRIEPSAEISYGPDTVFRQLSALFDLGEVSPEWAVGFETFLDRTGNPVYAFEPRTSHLVDARFVQVEGSLFGVIKSFGFNPGNTSEFISGLLRVDQRHQVAQVDFMTGSRSPIIDSLVSMGQNNHSVFVNPDSSFCGVDVVMFETDPAVSDDRMTLMGIFDGMVLGRNYADLVQSPSSFISPIRI